MEEIIKLTAVAVIGCILIVLVRQHRPELSLLIQLAGLVSVLVFSVAVMDKITDYCKGFLDEGIVDSGYLKLLFKALGIAVIVVVEGWGASGKGALINNLILPLDPRGFLVYTIKDESEEEMRHPFLWRFMTKTPKKGEIAIFDRSWYRRVLNEHIEKKVDSKNFDNDIEEIKDFEKMLADDGVLIVKYFLHITKEEQKKRLDKTV